MERIETKLGQLRLDPEFDKFLTYIEQYDPMIYGGFIRDILADIEPKNDIDIVLFKAPYPITIKYPYVINKFGGIRFKVGDQEIDMWRIEDTRWIKEQNLLPTIQNLFLGTNKKENKVAYYNYSLFSDNE